MYIEVYVFVTFTTSPVGFFTSFNLKQLIFTDLHMYVVYEAQPSTCLEILYEKHSKF